MEMVEVYAARKKQVSCLYVSYAEKFATYAAFWRTLAEEEARAVALIPLAETTGVLLPGRPTEAFSRLLDVELKLTHEPRLSLLHAFTTAFEVEQALSAFISSKDLDAMPVKMKEIFIFILAADRSHLEQIRLAMAKFS